MNLDLKGFNFDDLIRVELLKSEEQISETLERLGIGLFTDRILWQTSHLIKIVNDWYVIHYKEVYGLIGKEMNWCAGDIERRNKIATMLEEWGMLKIVNGGDIYYSYGREVEVLEPNIYKIRKAERNNYDMRVKVFFPRFKKAVNKYNEEIRQLNEG